MTDLEKIKKVFDEIGIKYEMHIYDNKEVNWHDKSIIVDEKHMNSYGCCMFNFDLDTEEFKGIEAE